MDKPKPYKPEAPPETEEDNAIWEQMRNDAVQADAKGEKVADFLSKTYEVQKKTSTEKVNDSQNSDSSESVKKEDTETKVDSEPKAEEVDVKPEETKDESKEEVKQEEVKSEEKKEEPKVEEKHKNRAQERIEQLARERNEERKKREELEQKLAEKESKIVDPLPKFTVEELESMIPKWREEGRDDLVQDAFSAIATKHKIEAEKWKPKPEAQKKFEDEWRNISEQMMAEDDAKPEGERLGLSDANSPVTKMANAYIQDERYAPFFLANPQGMKMAVEVAKMKLKADSAESLKKENQTLKEENKKLREAVSLDDSPPSRQPSQKSFDDLSEKEKENFFKREFRELDKRNASFSLS